MGKDFRSVTYFCSAMFEISVLASIVDGFISMSSEVLKENKT
jgi:hypothetical protein